MRWTPTKVTSDLAAYDTLTFSWAASAARTYATRNGAPAGRTSTVAPASISDMLVFDVPREADMFGVEFVTQQSTNNNTTWSLQKIEAFAESEGGGTTDFTFALDSGLTEEPYIWQGAAASGIAAATSLVVARRFIDVSGGDANWGAAAGPVRGGNSQAIKKQTIWFSPFGSAAGLPYIGNYRRIYFTFSLTPNAGITATYTVKLRPVAVNFGPVVGAVS